MSRVANTGVRVLQAFAITAIISLLPLTAAAQTTVVINDPAQTADARITGGSYANTNYKGQPLATKVHPTDQSYTRRSVFKFDTHNTIPSGATVQSAKLTLTLSSASAETRTLSIYRLSQTFDPIYVTWYTRKSGSRWTSAGGDLAEKWAQASVGATVGSKVTFDVTALVQAVVQGKYDSSRYTR